MGNCLSNNERKVLGVIQQGLPRSLTPYRDMAAEIGIQTDELLEILKQWQRDGKLRRVGAIVNHFKVGQGSGAMVLWKVESSRVDEVGQIFAQQDAVSHTYERQIAENWPWNFYTMVHAKNDEQLEQIIEQMSRQSGITEYCVLKTQKELKKSPPMYISERDLQK